jgi:hypothetical protein
MPAHPTRRTVLTGLSLSAAGALAGCGSLVAEDDTPTPEPYDDLRQRSVFVSPSWIAPSRTRSTPSTRPRTPPQWSSRPRRIDRRRRPSTGSWRASGSPSSARSRSRPGWTGRTATPTPRPTPTTAAGPCRVRSVALAAVASAQTAPAKPTVNPPNCSLGGSRVKDRQRPTERRGRGRRPERRAGVRRDRRRVRAGRSRCLMT